MISQNTYPCSDDDEASSITLIYKYLRIINPHFKITLSHTHTRTHTHTHTHARARFFKRMGWSRALDENSAASGSSRQLLAPGTPEFVSGKICTQKNSRGWHKCDLQRSQQVGSNSETLLPNRALQEAHCCIARRTTVSFAFCMLCTIKKTVFVPTNSLDVWGVLTAGKSFPGQTPWPIWRDDRKWKCRF